MIVLSCVIIVLGMGKALCLMSRLVSVSVCWVSVSVVCVVLGVACVLAVV